MYYEIQGCIFLRGFILSILQWSSKLMMRNNDNIAKVNDDDGSCLGWSLGPTRSACLTVALLKPNYCRNFYQLLAASTSHYQHLLPLLLSVLKNFKLLAVVYLVQIPLNTHLKVHSAQSTFNCGCNVDACQSRSQRGEERRREDT